MPLDDVRAPRPARLPDVGVPARGAPSVGRRSYEAYRDGSRPWHSAVAATYAHATAPLRRLQDRLRVEAALAVANGVPIPDDISAAFDTLPAAMAAGPNSAPIAPNGARSISPRPSCSTAVRATTSRRS